MIQYADYDYYKNTYMGTMPESDFNKMAKRASAKIKANTFGRINENNIPDEVKECTCNLADKLNSISKTEGLSSETVGPWSRSFNNNSAADVDNISLQIMKEFLSEVYTEDGTPVLYRGC